ncbi:sugar fermentation stimulation protein SfsA [Thermohalobacter berrensis]|uniref:Sugar fermentation stimulation protein homolog n=1 Tax=Thermohalobacter berrensis TaxID=99594 RepID=A0A419TBB7_9FIRM|nr:sugar fermentation stimulation protein SfsA [Thermohalobacter berrensis]
MSIKGDIQEAFFIKRLNRFVAKILVNNKIEFAHVPNTGRMKELLIKDRKVLVRKVEDKNRKTKYDLLMVFYKDTLVAIDSRLPNKILYKAFYNKQLPYFKDYVEVKKEINFGKSRFDIGLVNRKNIVLIEAKCVTLVENNIAKFPDAPTERGTKHIKEIIKASSEGFGTGIFFIIQRNDAKFFSPNWELDSKFSEALKEANDRGVLIKAITCNINKEKMSLNEEIPIILEQ